MFFKKFFIWFPEFFLTLKSSFCSLEHSQNSLRSYRILYRLSWNILYSIEFSVRFPGIILSLRILYPVSSHLIMISIDLDQVYDRIIYSGWYFHYTSILCHRHVIELSCMYLWSMWSGLWSICQILFIYWICTFPSTPFHNASCSMWQFLCDLTHLFERGVQCHNAHSCTQLLLRG